MAALSRALSHTFLASAGPWLGAIMACALGLVVATSAQAQIFDSADGSGNAGGGAGLRPSLIGDGLAQSTTVISEGVQAATPATANAPAVEPALPLGARRIVRDGDLTVNEPQAPVDGLVDAVEVIAPRDGSDAGAFDYRPEEDFQAFQNPETQPAGYNPNLFQIEQVETIDLEQTARVRDRRVRQLFADEDAYAPIGVRIGSFVLFPEIETGLRSSSNVFRSAQADADISYEFLPSARLVSNFSRHALEFRSSGTFTRFNEFRTENDNAYQLEARGRLDVTRRTNVEALVSREVTQEERSAINAVDAAGERTEVSVNSAASTLSHRFNRLRLELRGAVADSEFGDATTAGGGIISNSDRDNVTTEQALRASWEFKPTFSVFSEVAVNQRDFAEVNAADGISRSSTGERYRVGVSFGDTGPYLRGDVSVGYGRQATDDDALEPVDGLLIDANLGYRLNALTSFLLTANSTIFESTTANSGAVLDRSVGFDVRHKFREHLIGTAGVFYALRDFGGLDAINEREVRMALGMEYFFNSNVVGYANYEHTRFRSDFADSDYNDNEVRVGVRLRR